MEKGFIDTITSSTRGPQKFAGYMLDHISYWELITYNQIKELIEAIKLKGALYDFLPFCYLFLEIDLFRYYIEKANSDWNDPKIAKQINSFNRYPFFYEEREEILNHHKSVVPILKKIKARLIEEGAYEVINYRPNLP